MTTAPTPVEVTELESCPFCGGRAGFQEGHHQHWQVVCMKCGLKHPYVCVRELDPKPKLTAAWNTRHRTEALASAAGEPVAWMYEGPAMLEDETIIHDQKCFPVRQAYKPAGWTETPLYKSPPLASQHGLVQALEAVKAAMVLGADGHILETGWSISKLNDARPLIHAALKGLTGGAA